MAEEKMRAFEFEGKRRGVRLDDGTWQAIDWLADQSGVKWAELARNWVTNATNDDGNLTRVIRSAVMNELLAATILGEDRGRQLAAIELNSLMRNSGSLNDKQLGEVMKSATVQGEIEQGGFNVIFGHDGVGQDCVWIENNLRGWPHFALCASKH